MARHVYSLICSQAILDSDSNNLSLINVIERVTFGEEPPKPATASERIAVAVQFVLVSAWTRSDLEKKEKGAMMRAVVRAPSGKTLLEHPVPLPLDRFERCRARVQFTSMPYVGMGVYEFVVQQQRKTRNRLSWNRVSSVPLELRIDTSVSAIAERH